MKKTTTKVLAKHDEHAARARSTRRKHNLKELVSGITKKNRHCGIDWGRPAGKEVW
jgi:antitoxin component of MazEF toxin-antitoxin module